MNSGRIARACHDAVVSMPGVMGSVAALAALSFATCARASITDIVSAASLTNGSLAGTQFNFTVSYDSSQVTGGAEDDLPVLSFDFTLHGVHFSRTNIFQGGQVIFHYGVLYNVTADFYPSITGAPAGAPVNDIAFGFGGPGVIGYQDTNNQYGGGVFSLSATPQILSISLTNSGVQITFMTQSNADYVVQYTADLTSSNWLAFTNLMGVGGPMSVQDPSTPLLPRRFYRVGLVP